jgi:PAS domain S-box-containing protein
MTQVEDADVYRIDISDVRPIKLLGDLRWTGKAKFPGAPRPRTIVIFQLGEDVVAISAFCPHEQADLSEGRFVEPYVIECPLHQNRYDLRTGAIKTFSVEMDGDSMFLLWRRGQNEPVAPRLTQLRLGERTKSQQNETLERELQALRDAAAAREAHVVETLRQMDGMIREVEEKRRQAEISRAELGKVSEFVKRVTDSMSEALVVLDTTGRVRDVNARFTSLLGFSREEALGTEVTELVVAEQGERGSLRPFDKGALTGQRDAQLEACVVSKDGRRIEHLVHIAPLYAASGKREGAVLVCTNMQEVKAAQRELKSAYAKVQGLLDNMHLAVFVVMASGEIIQPVSRFTSQLFGEHVVGRNVFDVLYRDLPRHDPVYAGLMLGFQVTFGAESFQWELMIDQFPRRVLRKTDLKDESSEPSVLKVEYCPLFDERGEMNKLMLIVEDVSHIEQLQRERELSQLRTQILEELAKNRGEDLREFMASAHKQLHAARHALEQREAATRAVFFRELHTLKGNARVLGLSLIARTTHHAEGIAEPLRTVDGDGPMLREKVRDALVELQRQLAEYAGVAERILHVPNEIEARACAELHHALTALDAELPQLSAAFRHEQELRTIAARMQAHALTCRESAEMLGSDEVRHAAKAFQHMIALFTHPDAAIESSVLSDLHLCHEKLVDAGLSRRAASQSGTALSLSSSGWTALYLDVYALTQAVCQPSVEGSLPIERAAERAVSAAGTLQAELVPALLQRLAASARQSHGSTQLVALLRELWRHLFLHAALESLAMLRAEERRALAEALAQAERGDQALIALLATGRIRSGSVIGFLGALRRRGTSTHEALTLLATLFEKQSSEQIARSLVSVRAHEHDTLRGLLQAVDARTQPIGFDQWAHELGAPLALFSGSPRLGLGYLKRLDTLRLARTVCELVSGNFQLLFERLQTVEVMAFHYAGLQKRLEEYKRDKTQGALEALEQTIAQLLHVPIIPSLYKYGAMISEVATRLGKQAVLQIHGDMTAVLPRDQLYPLHDALVHLLRNAVDHGLELPAERVQAGKPERGTIEIDCAREGQRVKLTLRDDGRGIDPQKIKRKALELAVITQQEADKLSAQQLVELVFLPHFSTAQSVTDISGRGIGMDVVRESLSRIGVELQIDSRVGAGTTFTIRL